jgi:hypothetical protein
MRSRRNPTEVKIGSLLVILVLALTSGCASMTCGPCQDSYNNVIPALNVSVDASTNIPTKPLESRTEQTRA